MNPRIPLFSECIGKRVLMSVRCENQTKCSDIVYEYFVIEISPSYKYVKVRASDGVEYWERTSRWDIIECLDLPISTTSPTTDRSDVSKTQAYVDVYVPEGITTH